MRIQNKRKRLVGLIAVCLFLMSFALLPNNSLGVQDDSNLDVTVHGYFESDSDEIQSNLMGLGTYDYWETPRLDIGSFSHDLTTIDIDNIQNPTFNSTDAESHRFIVGSNATYKDNNSVVLNNALPRYTTSNNFQTILTSNINYSSDDDDKIDLFNEEFESNEWNLYNALSETFTVSESVSDDAYVDSDYPTTNYGDSEDLYSSRDSSDDYNRIAYFKSVQDYLYENYDENSKLNVYIQDPDFNDDFNDDLTNSWSFIGDTDGELTAYAYSVRDSYVESFSPDRNYGDSTLIHVRRQEGGTGTMHYEGYIKFDGYDFWTENVKGNVYIALYQANEYSSSHYHGIYTSGAFNEDTITWNNKPSTGSELASSTSDSVGWKYYNTGTTTYYQNYAIKSKENRDVASYFYSKEEGSYHPYAYQDFYEYYHNTDSGYFYVQTDESNKDIGMRSPTYSDKSINYLWEVSVDFESNADESLVLNYRKDGSQVGTKTFHSGSTSRTTKTWTVENDVTFDQLEIVGSNFDNKDRFKVYDIAIERIDPTPRFEVYNTTTSFDEDTITYSNKPDVDTKFDLTDTISSFNQYITMNIGDPTDSYAVRETLSSTYGIFNSKESSVNNEPFFTHYLNKFYHNDDSGYAWIQTNDNEELAFRSSVYNQSYYLQSGDKITLDLQTTCEHQVNLQLLKDGSIVKTLEIISEGNSDFTRHNEVITLSESVEFDQLQIKGTYDDKDYFKIHEIDIDQYNGRKFFTNLYVNDFIYTVEGINYTETFELSFNPSQTNDDEKEGNYTFFFDSTYFNNRTIDQDVIIPNQNLNLSFYLNHNRDVNISINIGYSSNQWIVPTESNMQINDIDVIDKTYKSGYVSFGEFQESLIIEADDDLYFELDTSVHFSFTFELNIISKTYLKRSFRLLSDHDIYLERIDFSDELNLKKVYLNNDEYGSSNPTTISPNLLMETNNQFNLEVLLAENTYIPLSQIYGGIGTGHYTTNINAEVSSSNGIFYNDIDENENIMLQLPNDYNLDSMDMKFSDLNYKPDYTSNSSENINDYGYTESEYGEEAVDWSTYEYYQTNQNATKTDEGSVSESNRYKNLYSESFDSENVNMSNTAYPDYNSTYSVSGNANMVNQFPNEQHNGDFLNWNLNSDSDYTTSSFSNGDLESTYREYTNSETPDSYSMNYGSYVSSGDLGSNNGNESTIRSTDYGDYYGTESWTDDTVGTSPDSFTVAGSGSGSFEIINSLDGHDKVTRASMSSGEKSMYRTFSDRTNGRVEWWWRIDSSSSGDYNYIYVMDGDGGHSSNLYMYNGDWMYYESGSLHDIGDYSADTWYNVELEFDATNSEFYVWVNDGGLNNGNPIPDRGTPTNYDRIYFFVSGSCNAYIDGYSETWDSNYDTDDNDYLEDPNQLGIEYSFDLSITSNQYYVSSSLSYDYTSVAESTSDFEVYDDSSSSWVSIGSSPYTIDESYYNANYELTIRFYEEDYDPNIFDLLVDQLSVSYTYVYDSSVDLNADITKNVDFSFLNRYDSNADYQDLYNVSIEFDYTFTKDNSDYSDFAEYTVNSQTFILTKDGSSHSFSYNFQFDSSSLDTFSQKFNISNGLLELSNYEYDLVFECIDTDNKNRLYQFFELDFTDFFSEAYQKTASYYLNFSLQFTPNSDDYYDYTNAINDYLLYYKIGIKHEDGINYTSFNSNVSIDTIITFNASDYLNNLSKSEFKGYTLQFYVAGNNSQLTIDNVGLYDYDTEFEGVDYLWISDTIFVALQDINTYFKAYDRNIKEVEIEQTFEEQTNVIFTESIENDTSHTHTYKNNTVGFYKLDFIFYDDLGNYQTYSLNFTIISLVSVSVAYENPTFVGKNSTVKVSVQAQDSITQIYYDNSSDYILHYDNTSYPMYNTSFSFKIFYDVKTTYNISVKVVSENSGVFYLNITNLEFILRPTVVSFHNLKSKYYKDQTLNMSIDLHDYENKPITSKDVNYTIIDPNDDKLVETYDTTDEDGEINISFSFNTSIDSGFYHLNVSFKDSVDTAYLGVWELNSFELLPILYSVNDGSIANLKVNDEVVTDNTHTITNKSNEVIVSIANSGTLTFDLRIENVSVSMSETNEYLGYIDYNYEHNIKGGKFDSLTITDINMTNVPDNLTYYYYDDVRKDSYTHDKVNNIVYPQDPISETFIHGSSFNIELRYYEDSIIRDQITDNPKTNVDSVIFKEYYIANRTFSYWYYENSLSINSLSIFHRNSLTTISDFDLEDNRYYFEQSCNEDDILEATIDYNPNWNIEYEITETNTTHSNINIDYKADFEIFRTSIILTIQRSELFDTTLKSKANENITLQIDDIDFTPTIQSIDVNINRDQITTAPTTNLQYVQFNETYTYNDEVIYDDVIDVKANYDFNYTIKQNNGTYSKLDITYFSDIPIEDTNVILDLRNDNLYNDNWSLEATQDKDSFKLNIPNVDFSTSIQSFNIEGYSEVPFALFDSFENEDYIEINLDSYESVEAYYKGYIEYYKYSEAFYLKDVKDSWILDGVHYQSKTYTIDTNTYEFSCSGFDQSITSSYLRFKANPINSIERSQSNSKITYKIDTNLQIDNGYLVFYIEGVDRYDIKNINVSDTEITKLYTVNDKDYYMVGYFSLEKGTTSISIDIETYNFWSNIWFILFGFGLILIVLFVLYIRAAKKGTRIYKIIFFWEKSR